MATPGLRSSALKVCLAAALGTVLGSCHGCPGGEPMPPDWKERDQRRHAREQEQDLRRWLENPVGDRVRCEGLDGLTRAAEELGFDRVAARHFEGAECFFRGGPMIDGGYVLVLHDRVAQRYGIQDVSSPQ